MLNDFILEKWIIFESKLRRFFGFFNIFKDMPTVLKYITVHALFCIVLLIMSLIPDLPINMDGQEVTIRELWSEGYGVGMALTGLIMPICGALILNKAKYSRHLYLLFSSIFMATPSILQSDILLAVFSLCFTLLMMWYLFFNKAVHKYYGL